MCDVLWMNKKTGTVVQVVHVANIKGERDDGDKFIICQMQSERGSNINFSSHIENIKNRVLIMTDDQFLKKYDVCL